MSQSSAPRFFVKCGACDQVFWLAAPAQLIPPHGRWARRAAEQSGGPCPGGGQPGVVLGEEPDGPKEGGARLPA